MGSIFTKGSGQSRSSEEASNRMAALAEQQAKITGPLRTRTAGMLGNFLQTGVTPSFLDLPAQAAPLAALSLPGIESERQLLRDRLLASGSRGGLLQQQLFQADLQGGLQRTGLMQQDLLRQEQRDVDRSGIARTLFGGAADVGTGGLSQAFKGIGDAAANLNSLGFQRIQQNQIAQQGIGQILGKVLGGAAGGFMGGGAGAAAGSRIGSGQAMGMK